MQPKIVRPHFPKGYLENPKTLLDWDTVAHKLRLAKNYWLGSVRPNGKPHTVPKWMVFVQDTLYFDGSPETRHAQNIANNKFVTVHLESGDDVVMGEGTAQAAAKPTPELAAQLAQAYCQKYSDKGYCPKPNQWDEGGLFQIKLTQVIAWTQFTEDPTKFVFEE